MVLPTIRLLVDFLCGWVATPKGLWIEIVAPRLISAYGLCHTTAIGKFSPHDTMKIIA